MNQPLKIIALGGGVGAFAAVAIIFCIASLGYLPPPPDKKIHDYLISHPSIVLTMIEKAQIEQNETEQRQLQDAINKIGLKTYFGSQIAFVTGPASAKKSVVEFFDYNCAHCRNSFPLIQKYYNAHKDDTRFAFIEFPIFGEKSNNAARAALAARRQPDKYVAFHFALMGEAGEIGPEQIVDAAHKAGIDVNRLMADLSAPEINKEVAAVHVLAARTGITGTPFFILNGIAHSGEVDEDLLKDIFKH
jgi:protein-disulfide isomerase